MTKSRSLHLAAAVLAVAVFGALATSALARTRSESQLTVLNRQVLGAINAFRVAHHLVPLRESPSLNASARQHSLEMGKDGYFAHPSHNGTAFWKRIQRYYSSRRYAYWSVGENLLWSSPDVSPAAAMKMWIASPEHLRNLLTPGWRSIGISSVHVLSAPGIYHGLPVTIITTDFGVRH